MHIVSYNDDSGEIKGVFETDRGISEMTVGPDGQLDVGEVTKTLPPERLRDFGVEPNFHELEIPDDLHTISLALNTDGRAAPGRVFGSTAGYRRRWEEIEWPSRTTRGTIEDGTLPDPPES